MTTFTRIQVYGTTTNTTDTTIYMQVSPDNSTYYNHNEKVILVDSTTGEFSTIFTDICVPYVKFYKANNSGSSETITLKTTVMH